MATAVKAAKAAKSSRQKALTELRRQEILRAAIKVFGRKGFAATCVEDVADVAGIAKGTLYLYFKSKEEIYRAAMQLAVQELQALSAERVAHAVGVRAKLAAAIEVRMEFWHEQQSVYRLVLTVGREPQHRKQTNELTRRAQLSLVEIMQAGVAAGELEAGAFEDIAWAVLDMIRGTNERRMDRVTERSPQEDAEMIAGFALRQVGL